MNYKVNVPEGISGIYKIEKIIVTEENAKLDLLRGIFHGSGRHVPAGTYTRLLRGGTLVMSDTPDEIRDHYSFINHATGNVLINGLGLGMALQAVLEKPEVTHVTVIEISQDVILLVGNYYKEKYKDRLTIINDNAFTWKPPKGVRYNAVWHDIWDYICADNLPEMTKLHRKYGRICDWQNSWCKYQCGRDR